MGQAISISGIFAVLTSLSISGLTRRLDRRHEFDASKPDSLDLQGILGMPA